MLLFSIVDRGENVQMGSNHVLSSIFATFSQNSHLNRKIYVFRLFPTEWIFSRLALTPCQAKNSLLPS